MSILITNNIKKKNKKILIKENIKKYELLNIDILLKLC